MHATRGDAIVFITMRPCYDDDRDMLKKRAIRVQRSRMSSNKGWYEPGKYGEEVVADSEN